MKIVFFVRDGELSLNTLNSLVEHNGPPGLVIIERRNKKAEIKTYINTQGVFRLAMFVLKSFISKLVRSEKPRSSSPENICNANNIPFEIVKSHNGKKSVELLTKYSPDIGVICAARIISSTVISSFSKGIINCHPGWLPDYRGWDALRWSVLKGKNIGITTHLVTPDVDGGPIIEQMPIDSTSFKSFKDIYGYALELRLGLLSSSLNLISNEGFKPTPQKQHEGKRYYRMNLIQMLIVNLKLRFNYIRS